MIGTFRPDRSSRPVLTWIAAAATAALLLALLGSSQGATQSGAATASLRDLARRLQEQTHYEFTSLKEQGSSLTDVARSASVVGLGRIVDVREGYRFDLGPLTDGGRAYERYMLIVIDPEKLLKGSDLLGTSGLVYVARPWSPAFPIERMRTGLSEAAEKVVFILTPAQLGSGLVDEYAGRQQDDAVFQPSQASTLLGVDLQRKIGFPLMTDELLDASAPNLDAVARVGAPVERFTTIKLHVEPNTDASNPGEPDVPGQ